MLIIKSFEDYKNQVELEYSYLKDDDIIENLARIDIVNDEKTIEITDLKNNAITQEEYEKKEVIKDILLKSSEHPCQK